MTDTKSLHEDPGALSPQIVDRHRAIASLMEELEAVDWYDQRVATAQDGELRAILAHNRDEEKEHAAMVIEWLRRNDTAFAGFLNTYLYSDASIVEIEAEAEDTGASKKSDDAVSVGSLKIGSLRAVPNQ